MTRLALALICFLVLAGCGSDLQGKMIGDWKVDTDYMKTMDEYKNASPEEKGVLDMMAGAIKLSVTDDKIEFKMSFMGQNQTESASYRVKEQKGDTLIVETTDGKGKTETGEIRFDGDTMILEKDGKGIAFKKA